MKATGYIRKFGHYNLAQCTAVRQKLSLEISPERLLQLSAYYRQERRDPTVEELCFLDHVATRSLSVSHRRALVHELHTNDAAAAETYADLMKKRHTTAPEARTPPTVAEIASIANTYLLRTGKRSELAEATLLPDKAERPQHAALTKNTVGNEGTAHLLHLLPRNRYNGAPAPEDIVLMFFKEELESFREYAKKVSQMLSSPSFVSKLKRLSIIGEDGLLSEILRHCNGCWLDLHRLTRSGVALSPSVLTDRYDGLRLAVVSRECFRDLIEEAHRFGIRATAVATVTTDATVTIVGTEQGSMLFNSTLLRNIASPVRAVAKLPNESGADFAPIHRSPLSVEHCAYLTEPAPRTGVARVGDLITSASSARPEGQYFRTALYATLSAVLELAGVGVDHTRQRLSICLDLPQTLGEEKTLGCAVATLLGLYRAQAELGIPAAGYRITSDRPIRQPELTVFSTAETTANNPAHWTTEGARIFCFRPDIRPDGLPDFAALRRAMIQLSELYRHGAILSHRVLVNQSVTEALASMQHGKLRASLKNPALLSEQALPLAILVEAYSTGEGWVRVGDVVRDEQLCDSTDGIPVPPLPPALSSLIWSDKRELLLLCKEGDVHAELLASALLERGARVRLFALSEERLPQISRAILTGHALLLCPGVTLPSTAELNFAVRTLLASGGQILSIQNASLPEGVPFLSYPNGLSAQVLDRLAAFPS